MKNTGLCGRVEQEPFFLIVNVPTLMVAAAAQTQKGKDPDVSRIATFERLTEASCQSEQQRQSTKHKEHRNFLC